MMGKMIIDSSNVAIGNRAMAAVLLLYYHLRAEGGIIGRVFIRFAQLC